MLSKIVPINSINPNQIFYTFDSNFFHQNEAFLGLLFCGLCPGPALWVHPASGIRLGFSGNPVNASGIRLGRPDDLVMAALAFLFIGTALVVLRTVQSAGSGPGPSSGTFESFYHVFTGQI